MRNRFLLFFLIFAGISIFSLVISNPGRNGDNPGCSGSSCHNYEAGGVSVTTDGLNADVTDLKVSSGEKVAGELVTTDGKVVDVFDASRTNPFTLTAPAPGIYVVYAGYKSPSRQWDSLLVEFTVSGIENSAMSLIPEEPELFDNHPNPFNNETMIRFSLPNQEQVQLKIININGQVVRNLVNNGLPAGTHSIRWDGRDNQGQLVASGLYLYQLSAGSEQMTKRLILAK